MSKVPRWTLCGAPLRILLLSLLFYSQVHAQGSTGSYQDHDVDLDPSKHDDEFFTFVTRPDLLAPRWDIDVFGESRVSPGYWFTAPYNRMIQAEPGALWDAPYIYDSKGELIWSGAPMFEGWTSLDFRVINVMGKSMLSLINYHNGNAWILDDTYSVYEKIQMRNSTTGAINVHEFVTVENGREALHLTRDFAYASRAESMAVGFDGSCFVHDDGFKVYSTETWQLISSWTSADHIGLNESYEDELPVEDRCSDSEDEPWDYIHLNSIDKFPDGDYLLSSRRTFALYKVSSVDGSIVWRLGGKQSDFELDLEFSGQHGARVHDQNETHTIISFFDNAEYKPFIAATHESSRGVLLSLRTDSRPMRAETLRTFDHPSGNITRARGNMEMLPNGNFWICWARDSMHTEHGSDGSLIMQARIRAGLGSYRDFKSPWVGRPSQPPDVRSVAVETGNKISTIVHVSWNGATEVARWKVWRANRGGRLLDLLSAEPRQGFETAIDIATFADYVVAEAIDREDASLGKSKVFQTIIPDDVTIPAEEVIPSDTATPYDAPVSEDQSEPPTDTEADSQAPNSAPSFSWFWDVFKSPLVAFVGAFVLGGIVTVVILGITWTAMSAKWKRGPVWPNAAEKASEPLLQDSFDEDEDSIPLTATRSRTSDGG